MESTDPRSADPHDAVELRPALFQALDTPTTRVLEQTDTSTPASVNGHSTYTGRDLYLSTTRTRTVPPNPDR